MPDGTVISIVVPLLDMRDFGAHGVLSWLRQEGAAGDYELVVVSNRHARRVERELRSHLRPQDQIVYCEERDNEAVPYSAGAAATRGNLILLTECHVRAAPDALARVRDYFARHDVDAAVLGTGHISDNLLARVDQRQYELEEPAMHAAGAWRAVGLRGLAIRRDVYLAHGPFNPDYLRFAETALAIQLMEHGRTIGLIEGPLIFHKNVESLAPTEVLLRLGSAGECAYWRREPELAAKYFGAAASPWANELPLDPDVARAALRTLLHSTWNERGQPGWREKVEGLPRYLWKLLPAALLGWSWARGQARLRLWRDMARMQLGLWRHRLTARAATSLDGLLPSYGAFRQAAVQRARIDFRASMTCRLTPRCEVHADDVDARAFAAFHELEYWQGLPYRWSLPVGVLRLPGVAGPLRITLDVRPTGPVEHRALRFYVNGQPLDPAGIEYGDGQVRFDIARAHCVPGSEQVLSFTCTPFFPADSGLPDRRALGIAVVSVDVATLTEEAQSFAQALHPVA